MKVQGMEHGIYEIYWQSGGSSLASVGYNTEGYNWMSPCNWTSGETLDWSGVKALKMLIPNEYGFKTKSIRSDYNKVAFNNENFKISE